MKAQVIAPALQEEIVDFIAESITKHGLARRQILDVLAEKGYPITKKNYQRYQDLAFKKIGQIGPDKSLLIEDRRYQAKLREAHNNRRKEIKVLTEAAVPERSWKRDEDVRNFLNQNNG